MTMADLPVVLLLAFAAVSALYGLVGGGLAVVGARRSDPPLQRFGSSLALASGCTILVYGGATVCWTLTVGRADRLARLVATSVVAWVPAAFGVPILVGAILSHRDDLRRSLPGCLALTVGVVAFVLGSMQLRFLFLSQVPGTLSGPVRSLLYVGVVAALYGLVGGGLLVGGLRRASPALERAGSSLVLASGCTLLAYAGAIALSTYDWPGGVGRSLGESILFAAGLPALVGAILSQRGDLRRSVPRSVALTAAILALVVGVVQVSFVVGL